MMMSGTAVVMMMMMIMMFKMMMVVATFVPEMVKANLRRWWLDPKPKRLRRAVLVLRQEDGRGSVGMDHLRE